MAKKGKNHLNARDQVDRTRYYAPEEAIGLAKEISYANFDATMEIHMRMGVDPRHADQQVRSVVLLPHGLGKEVRILVFAEGEADKIAREAGADHVGSDDLVERIQEGWLDFDVVIAIPQMMGKVGKLGRVLGPRGLMPNPKAGTIVPPEHLPRVIEEARLGRVEFRVDKTANLHAPIGKASFPTEKLVDNMAALFEAVQKAKPPSAKGQYIRRITLTTTMGPGIKIDTSQALALETA